MSLSKTPKIPRLVADIQRDLDAVKKPRPDESMLGISGVRLGEMSALLTELAKAKKFWSDHEEAEAARLEITNREREQQLYQNLERESDPAIRRRHLAELRGIRGMQ